MGSLTRTCMFFSSRHLQNIEKEFRLYHPPDSSVTRINADSQACLADFSGLVEIFID
jgi:hypothetical protein